LKTFKIIAFTHKNSDLSEIGRFHIDPNDCERRLAHLKNTLELKELMYLSTCNRVEFLINSQENIDETFLNKFFAAFNPAWNTNEIKEASKKALIFEAEEAVAHFFNVASSLDSLVVGEREIITQVRNSFETSRKLGLSGDLIRIVVRKTIETAKQVYTQTAIAAQPVSIVSLANRKLRDLKVKEDARILIVGAGQTNTSLAKYLKKHRFKNFTVFNRTLEKAVALASELKGSAFALSELASYKNGFDVLITCTGSSDPIITEKVYESLLAGDKNKKVIVDLAVPNDFDKAICDKHTLQLIEIESLKQIAEENLKKRHLELAACNKIIAENLEDFKLMHKTRKVELAMSDVPKMVRDIKEMAIGTVFAKEVSNLDQASKETLDKILAYMEKKYISVPMKMAKEILLKENELK
jgi:glutamyl-tRNA reductase